MKRLLLVALAITGMTMSSCKKDSNSTLIDETAGLAKVQEISDANYTVEIYTSTGSLQVGYNEIYLRLKENVSGDYQSNANFSWMPVMQMISMSHSCPKSNITKVTGKQALYKGYIVFQMPENADEHWRLTITYQTGDESGEVSNFIAVPASPYKRVSVFTGTDSKKYIIALAQPANPIVAINDLKLGVFSMESMMMFPQVPDYQISFDPRMPDMGNHSSPNNENPEYNDADGFYDGKLSLTMTGKWKLNLIVKNTAGDIIKGEPVSDSSDSSLYLELEAN